MTILLILASFGFLLCISYGVLAPYRDSGDLVAAAYSLGIAHPPGYALYTLFTKIGIELFSLGNFAYRANFLSALWTALACGILFSVLKKSYSPQAALLAIAVWFFSPSVIQLSTVSEMYSLNALFCSLVLFFYWKFSQQNHFKYLFLCFFLVGIGLLAHPTIVFLLPALLWVWWRKSPALSWERAGQSRQKIIPAQKKITCIGFFTLFGALGFSLIFFYPIRSFCQPLVDWGDPETPLKIWRLITRADYGGLKLHPEESVLSWSFSDIWNQSLLFLKNEWQELRWWGVLFAVVGIVRMVTARQAMSFNLITFLISGPLFFTLSNLPPEAETTLPILEPYLVMTNLFAVPWMTKGIETLFTLTIPRHDTLAAHPRLKSGATILSLQRGRVSLLFPRPLRERVGVRGIAFVAILGVIIWASLPHSRRGDFFAYDYGKNLLKTVPPNSSLYDPDDATAFILAYLQVAENQRTDLALLMTLRTRWGYEQLKRKYSEIVPTPTRETAVSPDGKRAGVGIVPKAEFRSAQEFIPALLATQLELNRPLFTDHASKFFAGMEKFQVGLLSRAGRAPEAEEFLRYQKIFHFYVEGRGSRPPLVDLYPDFFTKHLLSRISASLNNIGIQLQNQKKFEEAENYFRQALLRQPNLSEAWNNLGLNFYFRGDANSAEKVFQQGIKKAKKKESLYYHLSLAQKKMGKIKEAKISLEQEIKLNPQKVDAINDLGLIFFEQKEWQRSQELFERCISLNKNYAPAYYNLGLVYRALGKKKESAESFENYLRFAPGAEDEKQVRSWIFSLRSSL